MGRMGVTGPPGPRVKVGVGDQAPGFKTQDVTYHDIDEADYRGRNNLVLFFYSDGCSQTCRVELMDLADKYDYITQEDGEVIAISTDGFNSARDMALDLHLPFHMVSDPNGDITREYGVYDNITDMAYPALFLIDKNGVVRYRKIIEGLNDLAPADDIVKKLKGMGTPHGEIPFQSFRYD